MKPNIELSEIHRKDLKRTKARFGNSLKNGKTKIYMEESGSEILAAQNQALKSRFHAT